MNVAHTYMADGANERGEPHDEERIGGGQYRVNAEQVYQDGQREDAAPTADKAKRQAHEHCTDVSQDLHVHRCSQQFSRSLMIFRKPGCSK